MNGELLTGLRVTARAFPDGRGVLELAGELDVYTLGELRAGLRTFAQAGIGAVVVDLRGTTFVDVGAIRLLAEAGKTLDADGGSLTLVCADRDLLRAFALTGLDRELAIRADL